MGCEPYSGQHLTTAETKLKNGEITIREFVRQLAKSNWFRNLYWDKLYITKAIESIHRRLLGRPTYGRSEMSQYYDLCSKKGFYALIDAIVDSDEYLDTFGEDTVPYERYLTPRGWAMRSLKEPINWSQAQLDRQTTAGEVVAQRIREDKERLAKLASGNNGGSVNVTQATKETNQNTPEEIARDSTSSAVVTNSTPAETKPESTDIADNPQEEKNYEYSQTTDS